MFLEVFTFLLAHEHSFVPSATTVQVVAVTSNDLARRISEWILEAAELESIRELLAHEPATWRCRVTSADGRGIWRLVLSPFLHPYAGSLNLSFERGHVSCRLPRAPRDPLAAGFAAWLSMLSHPYRLGPRAIPHTGALGHHRLASRPCWRYMTVSTYWKIGPWLGLPTRRGMTVPEPVLVRS